MANRVNINETLESSEMAPLDKAISNSIYGFNHSGILPVLQSNKDKQGYTFFVKPQLNLTDVNIRNIRQMYGLFDKNELSANRIIRTTLDPRLQWGINHPLYNQDKLECPLIDMFNPFIPILSNTLTNLSGWPDIAIPTFTSKSGLRKEQLAMVDGTFEMFDVFDLSATFKSFINEPLTTLFQTWTQYSALVFEGMLYPYIDMITENEFDYNTRIYRFVMDTSGRYIKKSACTGAAFPTSVPVGKFFDLSADKPYSSQTEEINITFKCMGARINDDLTFLDFNDTVAAFNPEVRAYLQGDVSNMIVIPYDLLPVLSNRGYPIVDLETYELKWLLSKDSPTYKRLINADTEDNSIPNNDLNESVGMSTQPDDLEANGITIGNNEEISTEDPLLTL